MIADLFDALLSPPYAIYAGIVDDSDTDTWSDRGGTPLAGYELLVNDGSQTEIRCATLDDAKSQAEIHAEQPLRWSYDDAGVLWGSFMTTPESVKPPLDDTVRSAHDRHG